MSSFFEEAYLLLHVAEKALMFPQLKPLHDAAVKKLHGMQKDLPSSASLPTLPPVVEPLSETFQQKIEDDHEE